MSLSSSGPRLFPHQQRAVDDIMNDQENSKATYPLLIAPQQGRTKSFYLAAVANCRIGIHAKEVISHFFRQEPRHLKTRLEDLDKLVVGLSSDAVFSISGASEEMLAYLSKEEGLISVTYHPAPGIIRTENALVIQPEAVPASVYTQIMDGLYTGKRLSDVVEVQVNGLEQFQDPLIGEPDILTTGMKDSLLLPLIYQAQPEELLHFRQELAQYFDSISQQFPQDDEYEAD